MTDLNFDGLGDFVIFDSNFENGESWTTPIAYLSKDDDFNYGKEVSIGGLYQDYIIQTDYASSKLIDKLMSDGVFDLGGVSRINYQDISVALDTGKGEIAGQAYRLYKASFDRAPDQEGLGYWINAFDHGADLTGVASSFIASPEFAAMYGANSTDTNFVTLLYNHVLHRYPDPEGNAYWLNALQNGTSRGAVLASFSESPENIAQTAQLVANGIQYQEWTQ